MPPRSRRPASARPLLRRRGAAAPRSARPRKRGRRSRRPEGASPFPSGPFQYTEPDGRPRRKSRRALCARAGAARHFRRPPAAARVLRQFRIVQPERLKRTAVGVKFVEQHRVVAVLHFAEKCDSPAAVPGEELHRLPNARARSRNRPAETRGRRCRSPALTTGTPCS